MVLFCFHNICGSFQHIPPWVRLATQPNPYHTGQPPTVVQNALHPRTLGVVVLWKTNMWRFFGGGEFGGFRGYYLLIHRIPMGDRHERLMNFL